MAKTSFYSGSSPAALNAGLGLYVLSFKGRSGEVVPVLGDYSAALVSNAPAGGLEAETVQGALYELDAEVSDLAEALEALPPSGVQTVAAGTGVSVDSTIPATPTVALSSSALTSLGKADSALQPSAIGVTVASKAQGDLANNAVQSVTAGTGMVVNSSSPTAPVVALTSAVQTSLGKADTALQPAVIGTSVQAYDSDLQAIAALAPADDSFIQRKAGAWTGRTFAQVRTDINSNQPYGPYGTLYTGSDLNDIVANGRYMGQTMANAPTTGWWVVDHLVQGNSPTTLGMQVAYSMSATPPLVHIRRRSGTWEAWSQIALTTSLPGIPAFTTKAEAESYNPNSGSPDAIRILSRTGLAPNNKGQEWLGRKVASVPAHENYVTIASGTIYERVPAAPASPANIFELGIDPSNATAGFNKVITAWKESGFSDWYHPGGGLVFKSRPIDIDAGNDRTFRLTGSSRYRAEMYKDFVSGGTADGILNIRQSDVHLSDLSFVSLVGSQNGGGAGTGCFVSAASRAGRSLGYCSLSRLHMTGGAPAGQAYHSVGMYFVGSPSASPVGVGIRGFVLSDIVVFGGGLGAALFDNVVALTWMGGGTFQAGGLAGTIYCVGNEPTAQGSESIHISLSTVSNGATFYKCSGARIDAAQWDAGVINFASTANGCHTSGRLNSATVSNAGVACAHNGW